MFACRNEVNSDSLYKAASRQGRRPLDILTIALCISIGNAVAWLIALYTQQGVHLLLWNMQFGTVGAALCAAAITWIAPTLGVVGLVTAGPLCGLLMIVAGDAVIRAILGRSS